MDEKPSWLQRTLPWLHRFLTRDDKPWPAVREFAIGALIVLVVLGTLWGYTGQPLGRSPIVVVESGSMMHCTNGLQPYARDCDATRYGRLGTVDPGDLILVKDVDGKSDVATYAAGGDHHYGRSGDVIVYRPDGNAARTPVIHRALFWLQINDDGTFSVPEFHLDHIDSLDRTELQHLGLRAGYANTLRAGNAGPEDSGFVTRGDNNAQADQGTEISNFPVAPSFILGKARGEIPWLGLVKLYFSDFAKAGCPKLPVSGEGSQPGCNYHNAGGDSKFLLLVTLGILLGGPYVFEKVRALRRKQADGPPPQ